MRRVRRTALALATLTLLVSVVSTGGFSSVSAERTVQVAVADDPRAYLSIAEPARNLSSGEQRVTLLTLRNRFPTDLTDVEVTVTGDGAPPAKLVVNGPNPVEHPESLAVGSEGDVVVTVVCDGNGGTDEFRVAVDASGPGAGVELNRTVRLACPVQRSSGQSGGGGNSTSS